MDNKKINSLKEMAFSGGFNFLYVLIGLVLMFFFRIIAARYFGPTNYGIYEMTLTVFNILLTLSFLGIPSGISRFIPIYFEKEKYDLLKGYIRFVLFVPIITSLFLSSLLFLYSNNLANYFGYPVVFSLMLKIISILLPLKILSTSLKYILTAKKKVLISSFSDNVLDKIILFSGIFLISFLSKSIVELLYVLLFSTIILLFYDFYFYKKYVKLPQIKKPQFLYKKWIWFSLPLFFSGAIMYFLGWTDNLVIGKIMDPASLGIYSVAYSFASIIVLLPPAFQSIFMPLISENYAKNNIEMIIVLFKKTQVWTFALAIPLALGLAFFSNDVLNLFFGPEYVLGYNSLIILSFGFLFTLLLGDLYSVLILYGKTKFVSTLMIFVGSLNFILNIYFVTNFGIIGAAITSCLSIFIQKTIMYIYLKKFISLEIDWIGSLKYFSAGLFSLVAVYFIRNLLHFNMYLKSVVLGSILICLYLFFIIVLKTFDEDDITLILSLEKKLNLNLHFIKKIIKIFLY